MGPPCERVALNNAVPSRLNVTQSLEQCLCGLAARAYTVEAKFWRDGQDGLVADDFCAEGIGEVGSA